MDQIIEQVTSEVRQRTKRSLWGNMLMWLNEESSGDNEGEVKKPVSRPTKLWSGASHPTAQTKHRSTSKPSKRASSSAKPPRPTAGHKPSTQQDPSCPDSDGQKVSVLRRMR